eukprot:TRINITY_DN932_c2_g2_i1.p2 TRINITY_DN932_c2_g2~~TRINITY_DN932_c2_g2_i1.p2  ORF type:complete len:422 (+),score=123.63 TRINITY_DN932_c2_g2_i1:97-1266(+)
MAALWNILREEVRGTVDDFREKGAIGALQDAALDTRDIAAGAGGWLWGEVRSFVESAPDDERSAGAANGAPAASSSQGEATASSSSSSSPPPTAGAAAAADGAGAAAASSGGGSSAVAAASRRASELLGGLQSQLNDTVEEVRTKGAAGALKDAALDAVDIVGHTTKVAANALAPLIDLDFEDAAVSGSPAERDAASERNEVEAAEDAGGVGALLADIRQEVRDTIQDFREKGAVETVKDAALDTIDIVRDSAGSAIGGARSLAGSLKAAPLPDLWAAAAPAGDDESWRTPASAMPGAAGDLARVPAAPGTTSAAAEEAAADAASFGEAENDPKVEKERLKRQSLVSTRRPIFEKGKKESGSSTSSPTSASSSNRKAVPPEQDEEELID